MKDLGWTWGWEQQPGPWIEQTLDPVGSEQDADIADRIKTAYKDEN